MAQFLPQSQALKFDSPIFFATLHKKGQLLSSLFAKNGISLKEIEIDSDQFGTFSDEIPRLHPVKETLMLKVNEARKQRPAERYFLASEGSFGAHPYVPMLRANREHLLFYDNKIGAATYVDYISTEIQHVITSLIDYDPLKIEKFVSQAKLPSHACIVRTADPKRYCRKGIVGVETLKAEVKKALSENNRHEIILENDLRAHLNPTRQKSLVQAAEKLLKLIDSNCPSCTYPTWTIREVINGLKCSECGFESDAVKNVIYKCLSCDHTQEFPRPDGYQCIDPDDCPRCNG